MGSTRTYNLASKAGEAFYAQGICNESDLHETVSKDIAPTNAPLTRIMFGKWKAENNESLSRPLVDALNDHASPNEIATNMKAGGRGTDITFTYTKPDGSTGLRQVSVEGVSGNSLRARDLADDSVKSFRLDRISNARAS